jgi:hypothetical protein
MIFCRTVLLKRVRHLRWIKRTRLIKCKYSKKGYFSAISDHVEVLGRRGGTAKPKSWDMG